MHEIGHIVVQIWKGDAIFRPNRLANDNFVDVIKFIPIFVLRVGIFDQWLKFGTARNSHVQCFSSEERFQVEQVEVVVVDQICQKLIGQTIEGSQLGHGQVPLSVCCTVDMFAVYQRFAVVEPR